MAEPEPLDCWRIEIEQTNRFQRSREYRVGGPRSLTWVYEHYDRDEADPWSMKLGSERAVVPWPVESWVSEHDVPERDGLQLDPRDESSFWKLINTPFFGEQVEAIPGYYSLRNYVYGLVDGGRPPKRVRIEYEQTEYRGVCTVTVLEWGAPSKDLTDYVAEPSSSALSVATMGIDQSKSEPPTGNVVDLALLSVNGVRIGMTSNDVLELWREAPFDSHVLYDARRGVAVFMHGDSLGVEGRLYEAGQAVEPLLKHLENLGFEDFEFPVSQQITENAEEIRARFRAQSRFLRARNAFMSLQLDDGRLATVSLSGGTDDVELQDSSVDWIGPELTIRGLSLGDDVETVVDKLGPPHRIHQQEDSQTLCYSENGCDGTDFAKANVHITFESGRCLKIRGDQFEQAGRVKLGSGFPMPPPHSLSEVSQALSFGNGAFTSRPAKSGGGPVTIAYNTDVGMQVWIYPDGRRQFLLQEVELPETIVEMDFP